MNKQYPISDVPDEAKPKAHSATDAQKRYLRELTNRLGDESERKRILREMDRYTKQEATGVIDALLELPKPKSSFQRKKKSWPHIDDGRYAIMIDGTLKFFRVKNGSGDRWDGFMFLDAGRGGPHGDLEWTPIRDLTYKRTVLEQIAKNPEAAGRRFGQEVGVCYVCGRSLTDEISRRLGIGPICRGE